MRLRLAVWLLPALIALLLPALHVMNGLGNLRGGLQIETRQLADELSQNVSREPQLWLYKVNGLIAELEKVRLRGRAKAIRLLDSRNEEIVTVGTWGGYLTFTEQAAVLDSGAAVAYVELQADALSVLREAALSAAGGLALALLVWWLIVKSAVDSVGSLIARLRQARDDADDARAASRAKSQFLATMSHEIRTPMNGVLGMNELLLGSPLNPLQTEWARAVQNSGQHLLGVINDILDFSKIESGHLELEAVDFNLDDMAENALAMFAQPAEAKGLELALRFVPHDASFAVRGDPLRLSQVLTNLIGNAIKFTEEGEVVVRVELVARTDRDMAVRVSVKDSGIGIALPVQERIFEQFAQADGSTTRQHGGTGLGLAISRRLLTLMGGTLRVESAPGAGSDFIIDMRLPLAAQPMQPPASSETLEGVRVLVVDDNPTNRDILLHQLQGWGMHVRCVAGGTQALHLMDEEIRMGRPFDLAVLDMHMPKMDGLELATAIQSVPERAATRLVMLSSTYCSVGQRTRQQVGLLRFLNKPVRRADLQRALAETAAGHGVVPGPVKMLAPPSAAPAALHGRVLLVEDNPINQGVAKAMLGKMGLQVTVADDGAQGVARARGGNFDLVLMDCQMPVMDGFEATAAIRSLPEGRGLLLPVIALTANAMQGDEQACLDAGMNGFLAKPYTSAALRAVLARWLPQTQTQAQADADAPAAAMTQRQGGAAAAPAINVKAIEALRELEEPGSHELVTQLVTSFLETADGALADVTHALADGQLKTLSRAAHSLKSSAANLGAETLAACYGELEKRGREGRSDGLREWLDRARAEQRRVHVELRELLKVPA